MTWILYVLFMSDTREMQFVIEKRFFLTEQKCMRYYQNNSRYLDKKTLEIIQKEFDKFEIIHVGCMLQYDAEWNEDNKNAEWYRQQAIHYKQLMDRGEFYEPNF